MAAFLPREYALLYVGQWARRACRGAAVTHIFVGLWQRRDAVTKYLWGRDHVVTAVVPP